MDLKDIVSRQVYSTHHHLTTQQLTPISNRPSSSSSASSSSSSIITPLPKISCITEPPTPISPLIAENANDTRRPRSLPSPETSPESHQNAFKKTSVTDSTAIPPVASSSSVLIAHGSISPEQLPSIGPSSSSSNKRSLDDASSEEPSPKRLQSDSNKPSIALMAPTTVSSTSTTSRRHAHILSEQRRRENINGGFQLLKNTVPFCRGTQDSKAMILKKAVEYIMTLEHELSAYRGQQPQQPSSNEHHYHIPSAPQSQSLPQQQQSVDYNSYSYQQLPPPPPPPSAPPMQYQRQSIPPPLPNSYASSRAYYMNPISRPTSTPPLTNTYSMYSQRRKSDGSTNQLAPTTGSPNESPSSHQPVAHHQLAHHQMSYPPPPPRTYSPPSFMHGGLLPKP